MARTVTAPGPWRRTAAGALLLSAFGVLPVFLSAGLSVQIKDDLGLSVGALGAVPAVFFGAMTLASGGAGWFVRRLGVDRAIRVLLVGTALALAAISVVATSFVSLLLCLAAAGVVNAFMQPATNLLVAQKIPHERQGVAYGTKYSAIPIAASLSGLAVPTIALTLGWRWAYALFAVLALVVAVWPRRRATAAGPDASSPPADAPPALPRALMVPLALVIGFAAAGGSCLAIFMTASSVDKGWSEGAAGVILAVASVVGIASRIASGSLADRRAGRHMRSVALMLLLGAAAVVAMVLGDAWVYAAAAPVAFAAGWGWPGVFILAVVRLNPGVAAAATGFTQVGTSAGCVVGPLTIGLVAERHGYETAWSVVAVVLAVAAVGLLAVRSRIRAHLLTRTGPPG